MSTRRRHGIIGVTSVLLAAMLLYFSPSLAQVSSNIIQLVGKPSGQSPQLKAQGQDTNISINAVPKGTGCFQVNGVCIGSGSGVLGTGASPRVAVWSALNTITGFSAFTWDNANTVFGVGDGNVIGGGPTEQYVVGASNTLGGANALIVAFNHFDDATSGDLIDLGVGNSFTSSHGSGQYGVGNTMVGNSGGTSSAWHNFGDSNQIHDSSTLGGTELYNLGSFNTMTLASGTNATGNLNIGANNTMTLTGVDQFNTTVGVGNTINGPTITFTTLGGHVNTATTSASSSAWGDSNTLTSVTTSHLFGRGLTSTHNGAVLVGSSGHSVSVNSLSMGVSATPEITITAGSIALAGIVASGSATGKRVVCIDNTTKVLYTSSTGTDCSN